MRSEDLEIIEEALRNSTQGADFDEMLLRAVKKHLPRKYHKHFSIILEEIVNEADEKGISNRQAAASLVRIAHGQPGAIPSIPPPEPEIPETGHAPASVPRAQAQKAAAQHQATVCAPPQTPIVQAYSVQRTAAKKAIPAEGSIESDVEAEFDATRKAENAPAALVDGRAGGKHMKGASDSADEASNEDTGEGEENIPEVAKIVDLSGSHPEALPPELREKLKKVVKVQKKQLPSEEAGTEEDLDPHVWFRGNRPAIPLSAERKPVEGGKQGAGGPDDAARNGVQRVAKLALTSEGSSKPAKLVKKVKKV